MDNKIFEAVQKAKQVSFLYNPETRVQFPLYEVLKSENIDLFYVDEYTNPNVRGMSGAMFFRASTGKFTMIINRDEPAKRRYFTIAHELGHYFLHKQQLKEKGDDGLVDMVDEFEGALFRQDAVTLEEREVEQAANAFAAELLMPEDKVKEAKRIIGSEHVETYADLFEVSVSAMAIRMERLGLL